MIGLIALAAIFRAVDRALPAGRHRRRGRAAVDILAPLAGHRPLRPRPALADHLCRAHRPSRCPLRRPAAAVAIGLLLGAIIGYRGGWVDHIAMRPVDAIMAFRPSCWRRSVTAALGNSTVNVAIAISITQVLSYLRLIRGEMLRIREMEYADAARTVGNPTWRIVLIHLLPNCMPPLIVQATLVRASRCSRWPRCRSSAWGYSPRRANGA
ncbi:MAG: ABC transporter permease [Betaproteobacteria bacterium]|nr:ABC transporter permease [Betaproteobacteria bacterium]